jgi:hypothetical protein
MPRTVDEIAIAMLISAMDNPTLPANVIAPVLMLLGVVTIGVFLTISIRGRISRRQIRAVPPREQIEQIKERATSRAATTSATADMVQTARRLAAQLDNKAARLERLIADADERLARLEAYGADAAPATAAPDSPPRPDPFEEAAPDPLTRSVYELADNGHEPVDIAQRLDEQIGKVELILALRQ